MPDERKRLSEVANWYETSGFYAKILERGYRKVRRHFTGTRCLELGCADGAMTEHLVADFDTVVAVDGAEQYCKEVRERLQSDGLSVVHSLFENYRPDQHFHTIVLAHVLEHVEDPVTLLERTGGWLSDDGHIIIVVPNGTSLHRQVGAEMGIIDRPTAIDDHDKQLGHRRVYTRDKLHNHVRQANLTIVGRGGIALKPLTNDQMDEYLNEDIQNAYLRMGEEYPEMAAERFVIAK
ncbi:class I SAM-dependent methyltransferase [Salinibacter ruber]|uniref:class I SAM-dependent methyltransferase n=1 Tax=Salinibacter ruber TaxID=146919 RepID=UPI002169F002|nr:class I SAM-dependent methyltransferase [Salinibacter ruber]MCS4100845.1 2-polyprenyl-3-methyl-5-hydroxy-6-metoxy-1,4-benzoquinol methylase [Salinibacter ruber]